MQYRKLGNSELAVSCISLGTWKYEQEKHADGYLKICKKAIESGINFFDTSNNYNAGNAEKFIGKLAQESGRKNIIIGTKCFFPLPANPSVKGLSEKNIILSAEQSLRNLKTDYIDLLQCHRPDAETPIEDTISAMHKLKKQGKIREWGLGANTAAQLAETALMAASLKMQLPASHQHVYNMFNRTAEGEIMYYGKKFGLGLLAYSPLSQGILSNKYRKGNFPDGSRAASESKTGMWDLNEENLEKAGKIAEAADQAGLPVAAMALAWCMRNTAVSSVITFTRDEKQLYENINASEIKLDEDLLNKIEEILNNKPRNQYTKQYLI